MRESVERILEAARSAIAAAPSESALADLKARYLGKKSELKDLLKGLGKLPAAERPIAGEMVNAAARGIETLLEERLAVLQSPAQAGRYSGPDVTVPGFHRRAGLPHPLYETIRRIEEIFLRLGYGVAEGPDIEDDEHNFSDLNFPPDHPARDAQDTFFIKGSPPDNPYLLRTHTSPVQIRVMSAMPPPLAVIVPGRTYRSDAPDATHSPLFHQVEGLVVGPDVTMAHLKETLAHFAREFFGPEFEIRFRPSFFPFTEPSAEVDVSCVACARRGDRDVKPSLDPQEAASSRGGAGSREGTCRVCKGTGFLEVLGAGMVDPEVFEAVCRRRRDRVYDPGTVTGFAFGMGVERLAMLRHGVDDMRLFFENDPRFLEMLA